MKFLRTIRFDISDDRIFDMAAGPDEWAVPGGFAFSQLRDGEASGKLRQAFANGFLGLTSFGRSTFTTVSEISADDLDAVAAALAQHFVDVYGAPDLAAALPAAGEEVDFVADLCKDAPINTVFTLRRYFDDKGEIREEFRTITAPGNEPMHARIWTVEAEADET